MQKFYTLFSFMLAAGMASAQYSTPDAGTSYTLEALSAIAESGVVKNGTSDYTLKSDLTISAKDKIQLSPGDILRMADGVVVTVDGEAMLNPESTARIIPAEGAKPKGFKMNGKASLANLEVEGAGFMYFGKDPLIVDKCDFSNVNSTLSGYGVIVLSGSSTGSKITNSTFTDCEPGAINTPANLGVELLIEGCTIKNVTTIDAMRPFINIASCVDKEIIIRNNTLIGARLAKPGGIGVSNMLNTPGSNKVTIENNTVSDCSWGVNLVGGMDVRLVGNTVKDNRWDPADDGGIAVTMYSIASYPLTVYGEGNTFEGNKWGPCSVGSSIVNFGKTSDPSAADYNPGNNIFRSNSFTSTSGTLTECDFCNQTKETVYAQGNVWNDAKTVEEAGKTIFGSNYNSAYGPIVFDPIKNLSGVEMVGAGEPQLKGHVELYNLCGQKVYSGDMDNVSSSSLPSGVYVAVGAGGKAKIAL